MRSNRHSDHNYWFNRLRSRQLSPKPTQNLKLVSTNRVYLVRELQTDSEPNDCGHPPCWSTHTPAPRLGTNTIRRYVPTGSTGPQRCLLPTPFLYWMGEIVRMAHIGVSLVPACVLISPLRRFCCSTLPKAAKPWEICVLHRSFRVPLPLLQIDLVLATLILERTHTCKH